MTEMLDEALSLYTPCPWFWFGLVSKDVHWGVCAGEGVSPTHSPIYNPGTQVTPDYSQWGRNAHQRRAVRTAHRYEQLGVHLRRT